MARTGRVRTTAGRRPETQTLQDLQRPEDTVSSYTRVETLSKFALTHVVSSTSVEIRGVDFGPVVCRLIRRTACFVRTGLLPRKLVVESGRPGRVFIGMLGATFGRVDLHGGDGLASARLG